MSARKKATYLFPTRLNDLMERCSVTQSAIATSLDVSQAAVSGWVNGKVPVRRTAKALADVFGVRVEWLLYGEGEKLPLGRPEMIISAGPVPKAFNPPLSERSSGGWPWIGGLDAITLKEIAQKLNEASEALGSCAKIILRSAGDKRGGRKTSQARSKKAR
jgi:transcriptional regulator with XRE-family HTH domain